MFINKMQREKGLHFLKCKELGWYQVSIKKHFLIVSGNEENISKIGIIKMTAEEKQRNVTAHILSISEDYIISLCNRQQWAYFYLLLILIKKEFCYDK